MDLEIHHVPSETKDKVLISGDAMLGRTFPNIYSPHITQFHDPITQGEGMDVLTDGLEPVVFASNVTANFADTLPKPHLLAPQMVPHATEDMAAKSVPYSASMEWFWQTDKNNWTNVATKIANRLDGQLAGQA